MFHRGQHVPGSTSHRIPGAFWAAQWHAWLPGKPTKERGRKKNGFSRWSKRSEGVLGSICFGVIKDGKSPSKEVCGWEWRIVQQAMFNYQRALETGRLIMGHG